MYKSYREQRRANRKYKLIYFNLRGRAETIRLIFAAGGVDYEDFRMEREQWPALKPDMPFGTVPVLEVDGQQIGQSNTICRFLAEEFGLAGDNAVETAIVDSIAETITEMREKFSDTFLEQDEEKKAAKLQHYKEEILSPILDKLESQIIDNNSYFIGDKLSWADLHLFACCELLVLAFPSRDDALKMHPKMAALFERVGNEPKIVEWLKKRPETNF